MIEVIATHNNSINSALKFRNKILCFEVPHLDILEPKRVHRVAHFLVFNGSRTDNYSPTGHGKYVTIGSTKCVSGLCISAISLASRRLQRCELSGRRLSLLSGAI